MAERNDSHLLDGGDSVGMTDSQYKGFLLDQLEDWQEILELAIAAGNHGEGHPRPCSDDLYTHEA